MATRQIQDKEAQDTSKILHQWSVIKDPSLVSKEASSAFGMLDIYEELISLSAAVNFITEAVAGPCHRYVALHALRPCFSKLFRLGTWQDHTGTPFEDLGKAINVCQVLHPDRNLIRALPIFWCIVYTD